MKKNIQKTIRKIKLNDLKKFKYLDFNREVKQPGVKKLIDSIQDIGIQRVPNIVYTNIISGKYEYYIIDGQHLIQAVIALNIPELECGFILEKISSKKRMVKIITRLNSTASNWVDRNYLHAWKTIDLKEYKIINTKLAKFAKFTVSDILKIYSSTGKAEFKNGLLKLGDISKGDEICESLMDLFPLVGGKSSRFCQGYMNWRKTIKKYNHKKLVTNIKKQKYPIFTIGESPGKTAIKLAGIYSL